MIVTTKKLFKAAYEKYAIGAYNINNLEQAMGLFRGTWIARRPLLSRSAKGLVHIPIRTCWKVDPERRRGVPGCIFAVHLDHGDEETCYDCINSGFYSSVMIDASHEPFEGNIATTKRVVDAAHAKVL